MAHCRSCHATLANARTFDQHRLRGRCLDLDAATTDRGRPMFTAEHRSNSNQMVWVRTGDDDDDV